MATGDGASWSSKAAATARSPAQTNGAAVFRIGQGPSPQMGLRLKRKKVAKTLTHIGHLFIKDPERRFAPTTVRPVPECCPIWIGTGVRFRRNPKISENVIGFVSGKSVQLPQRIKESVQVSDVIVVILDVPSHIRMTENVFGFSLKGERLWQIQAIPQNSTNPINCYTGIVEKSVGEIRIANWNGTVVDVDIQTGKISRIEFSK